jgi:DNA polymerase elongation subunit (family B)
MQHVIDHTVTTAKVQTALIDKEQEFLDSKTEADKLDEAIEALLEEIGQFPHAHKSSKTFDPYLATATINGFCHVDEDYLLRHLHERPTLDMSGIKWKPQEIPSYASQPRCHFDIETEGLDSTDAVTMIGIDLAGEFGTPNAKWTKELAAAKNGGLIITYNKPSHHEPKTGFHLEEMVTTVPWEDGFKSVKKTYGVLFCEDERDMLAKTWEFLTACRLSLVLLHNGYEFDCVFLTDRCKKLGVYCPWTTIYTVDRHTGAVRKKINTATSMNGKPLEFFPTYWATPDARGYVWNDGSFPQIIDTLHLACQHDKQMGDMDGYGLKYIAADYLKMRDGRRTELSYNAMMSAWTGGAEKDLKVYREYLIFDLEDQRIISDFFMANIWAQQMFMPLPVQEIAVASPARKWNAILTQIYKPIEGERVTITKNNVSSKIRITRPDMDDKAQMTGGISRVSPGLYRRFYKVDVASLYPSIMLRWLLTDERKDPLGILLYILIQARTLRYHYKRLGNETTDTSLKATYKAIDTALKVLLNGSFGFTGAGGYPYNSMPTAALVTAYGRIMMRIMMHVSCQYHRIIEVDTDGLLLEITPTEGPIDYDCLAYTNKLIDKLSAAIAKKEAALDEHAASYADDCNSLKKLQTDLTRQLRYKKDMLDVTRRCRVRHTPEFVHAQMQASLPMGSEQIDASDIEKVGIVLELEEIYPEGVIYAPKAKNYIKFANENAKPSVKGIYRKRNRTPLQKKYLIEYIRVLAFRGKHEAMLYRNAVVNAIRRLSVSLGTSAGQTNNLFLELESGEYNVTLSLKDITTTQRIPNNSKWLVECNLGEAGGAEKVSYYWGHILQFGKPTKQYPKGRPIKGKEFPIRVTIDDQWNYSVNPQHIPSIFNPEHILYSLDATRYENAFLESIAAIDAVITAGEERISMTIEDDDLKLPEWYVEELVVPF